MQMRNAKIKRNDPCPCGSGKKYKKCCLGKPETKRRENDLAYARRHRIRLKSPAEVDGIRRSGRLVLELLDLAEALIRPGITTGELDARLHAYTLEKGAVPAPLNYRGFPKSICTSVNEVICHGIPGDRLLAEGDIVNVDVTPILDGFYADANKTFFVGTPSAEARKIVAVARTSLRLGMAAVKPSATIGDIGFAIQRYAESQGCSVVREFVGHGVGLEFHESPQVPHYGKRGEGLRLVPGMVFTIEPMINLGGHALYIKPDKWTAVTADGSLSAQFEQTLLVTEEGFESLTPYEL
jgi:methionyl aminopeptidase